jgi:hypothetical protein
MENNMKKWFVINLGLKGSWKWAKKQMLNGHIVRCKHWSGSLKLCIDDNENTRLLCTFDKDYDQLKWESSTHFLSYEEYIDYEIVKK